MSNRKIHLIFSVALCIFLQVFLAQTVLAQTASKAETAAISELAGKLNEEQSAALVKLLQTLAVDPDAAAAALDKEPGGWSIIRDSFITFGSSMGSRIALLPEAITGTFGVTLDIFRQRGTNGSLILIGLLAVVLAAGIAANFAVAGLATPWRRRVQQEKPQNFREQIKVLVLRFGLELSGLIAFVIVALLCARLVVSNPEDRTLIISLLLTAILMTRVAAAIFRFMLGPNRPDLRLVAADNSTAKSLFHGLVGLALIIGLAFFLIGQFGPQATTIGEAFRFWVGLLVVGWIMVITWQSRDGLTTIIKGEDKNLTPGLERMAAGWPLISMIVVLFTWLFIQFVLSTGAFAISPAQGATAISLVVIAPFLDTALRGIVKHMVPPMEGEGTVAEAAYHETRNSYVRIGRVLMFAGLIVIIGRTLGISLRNLTEAGLGAQIAANGVQFLLVLAGGYTAWEMINLWVNRRLAREGGDHGDAAEAGEGEGGHVSQSRLASVLPLIHITAKITIVIITVLLALSQLGFNITPLLAGAGVLGLAIGFGAQTLVKDIVSGVFFLLDDAFRVGEFIDVGGGTMGAVEKISVRSLQLRGARGPVHIVPYGTISKLTNNSRDWVIMKLKFTVPFDTDLEKVRKLFKKIGQEMLENPEHAENLLAPFKSQGVADVDDVGIVLRGKFTAKPGTQFVIRKDIYTRIHKAFEENGIQFARKEVRVQFPDSSNAENLTPAQKQAVAAAVSEAAEPKPVAG